LQGTKTNAVTSGVYKLTVEADVTRNGTVESVSNSVQRTV
jgi:hypothetical protein